MKKKTLNIIAKSMINEVLNASELHAPFHSAHEGYAVILEELDELWDEIKKLKAFDDDSNDYNLWIEANQIGAMAIRFIYDIIEREGVEK